MMKKIGIAGIVLLGILILAVLYIYLTPVGSSELRNPKKIEYGDFASADKSIRATITRQTDDSSIKPECRDKYLSHEKKTEKAVVLFHGYTVCTDQYDIFAKALFDQGYNVYVPLAPYHGTTAQDSVIYGNVKAEGLVDYANNAVGLGAQLGDELSVVGLSGGGVLATWAAEYRDDVVSRALILSPFYEPNAKQAAPYLKRPLEVLYGNHILPDKFFDPNKQGFSYYGLAQYLIIADNFKKQPVTPKLKSIALVTSQKDDVIDQNTAVKIVNGFQEKNAGTKVTTLGLSEEFGTGHDIGQFDATKNKDINGKGELLLPVYLKLLNGEDTSSVLKSN